MPRCSTRFVSLFQLTLCSALQLLTLSFSSEIMYRVCHQCETPWAIYAWGKWERIETKKCVLFIFRSQIILNLLNIESIVNPTSLIRYTHPQAPIQMHFSYIFPIFMFVHNDWFLFILWFPAPSQNPTWFHFQVSALKYSTSCQKV